MERLAETTILNTDEKRNNFDTVLQKLMVLSDKFDSREQKTFALLKVIIEMIKEKVNYQI